MSIYLGRTSEQETIHIRKGFRNMNVLMIGVDKTSIGGMLTVVENYLNNEDFCRKTNLKYIATVIRANKFVKIFTFLKVLPKIIYVIKKGKIDIVHVHMGERGSVFREGLVVWIAKRMGVKTVIHMHGATIEDWYEKRNRIIQKIIGKIFTLPDRMIVLGKKWSVFMEQVMGDANKDKIIVLHNAVNVEKTNCYNAEAHNVLFYGMLIPRKGIEDLLQAFQLILDQIPENVKLTIYGDDKEFDIAGKIAEYHLEGRAVYCGWLPKEERLRCFSETMLNVLPSYNEGLPMTILESMGYGIPNISTNIASIPEAVIDGINGNLIPPGDVDRLAYVMKRLILDVDLRISYSQEAYLKAKEEFSLPYHFKKLLNIYGELAS